MCSLLLIMVCIPVFAADGGTLEDGDFGFSFYTGFPYLTDFSWGNYGTLGRYYGIGAEYHPVASLSIEPGFFFSKTESEDEDMFGTNGTDEEDTLMVGGMLSAFYYGDMGGGLYYYAGPRFEFFRYENDEKAGDGSKDSIKRNDQILSLVFGLKYLFNEHVGIFGDMGFGWYSSVSKNESWDASGARDGESEERTNSFILSRTLLGVVFYF